MASHTQLPSYARIDDLPLGISIDDVITLLEQDGYAPSRLQKGQGSHLNHFEIQFRMQGRKITFGITDFDGKKRSPGSMHGYVRASHTVLQHAQDMIQELLSRGDEVRPGKRARRN